MTSKSSPKRPIYSFVFWWSRVSFILACLVRFFFSFFICFSTGIPIASKRAFTLFFRLKKKDASVYFFFGAGRLRVAAPKNVALSRRHLCDKNFSLLHCFFLLFCFVSCVCVVVCEGSYHRPPTFTFESPPLSFLVSLSLLSDGCLLSILSVRREPPPCISLLLVKLLSFSINGEIPFDTPARTIFVCYT